MTATVKKKRKSPIKRKPKIKKVNAVCWNNYSGCHWSGEVDVIDGNLSPEMCPSCGLRYLMVNEPCPGLPKSRMLVFRGGWGAETADGRGIEPDEEDLDVD